MAASYEVPTFEFDQRLPGGFRFPTRMTVLPLSQGKLALVSPIPLTDALVSSLRELGQVAYIIAPNLLHHLYLADAAKRFPTAQVLAPPGLRHKRPDLTVHGTLDASLPEELASAVQVVRVQGTPALDEYVLYHRATRALVVTDLLFHVRQPRGLLAHVVLWLVGCHGRLATSRMLRSLVKDRGAAARSVEQLLALPFETLVMAHGEVVRDDARAKLAAAMHWLLPQRAALPAVH